jgi:hypothetical protein
LDGAYSGTEPEESENELIEVEDSQSRRSQKNHKSSHSRSSKSQKVSRRSSREPEDSDQEPSRRPLANSFHENRRAQREDLHPNSEMVRTGSQRRANMRAAAQAKLAAKKKNDQSEDEEQEALAEKEKENAELKAKLARVTKQIQLERNGKMGKQTTNQEAMSREVQKCAKQKLWKVCKFIKNEKKLRKATRFVMKQLELADFVGLEGKDLINAEEDWIATYKEDVRKALNKQRNYVQQECRDLMMQVFKDNKTAEFPNHQELKELCHRDKLDLETPEAERKVYQTKFDNYVDVLLPKVAGHQAWNPNHRHYSLVSTGGLDDDGQGGGYVTPSDEAFLVTLWKNCYAKWLYKHKCKQEGTEVDPDHADMKTPFTNPKAGQKKYGGWTPEGVEYYDHAEAAIAKNRVDQKDYIKQVEELALDRIREKQQVAEKEASRKTKKVTGKRKSAALDEDEDDDEEDFSNW